MPSDPALVGALLSRGVLIHCPEATIIEGVDPERIEAGVELFPGTTLRGARTLLRAGTSLGRAGGGYFEDLVTGRNVQVWGGVAQDCVLLDDVVIRGHAELRGGTLLEEGCEAAHHVGYKMTVMMPFVVAGSLVNFCDVLFAGGTSRTDHGEIGSCLALYNYTPWGDKFASQFGDIPRGVTLRAARIFVGGQTQIVSPIQVGYGSVVAAGAALRRSVGEERIVADAGSTFDTHFDPEVYGATAIKVELNAIYIANLRALRLWYERVRMAAVVDGDLLQHALYREAIRQIDAGVRERIKRIDVLVARLPTSADLLEERVRNGVDVELSERRAAEQRAVYATWPERRAQLTAEIAPPDPDALAEVAAVVARACDNGVSYVDAIRDEVTDAQAHRVTHALERYVAALAG